MAKTAAYAVSRHEITFIAFLRILYRTKPRFSRAPIERLN
ncbi:hypothetical protein PT2222_370041 [Paraburkholderia tropica]